MRYYHTFISVIFAVLFCALLSCGGGDTNEIPATPIFSDVELIEAATVGGSILDFSLPDDVAYAMLGIFDLDGISEENFVAGNRTGIADFSRGGVLKTDIYRYELSTHNFDVAAGHYTSLSGGYYWAVWGYDSGGNLTHASDKIEVTYP